MAGSFANRLAALERRIAPGEMMIANIVGGVPDESYHAAAGSLCRERAPQEPDAVFGCRVRAEAARAELLIIGCLPPDIVDVV